MIRPHLTNALGSYPDRMEFQFERIIVQVQIPAHVDRDEWLWKADQQFGHHWRAIPSVIAFAQQKSRGEIPEFWAAHDSAGTSAEQLAVRDIWIQPADGSADYDVGCNFDFGSRVGLPELPDDYTIIVRSGPDGLTEFRR